jgi:hypothetical protein
LLTLTFRKVICRNVETKKPLYFTRFAPGRNPL